jgi:hypothetical protein
VGVGTGRQRVRSSSPGRCEIFLFSMSTRPVLGPIQPPIQWVSGVKLGREADYSPPSNSEVKNMWIYTSTTIRLHGIVLNYLSTRTTSPHIKSRP